MFYVQLISLFQFYVHLFSFGRKTKANKKQIKITAGNLLRNWKIETAFLSKELLLLLFLNWELNFFFTLLLTESDLCLHVLILAEASESPQSITFWWDSP